MLENFKMARVCFECHRYIPIFAENPTNKELLKKFNNTHVFHMVQTVNMKELDDTYEYQTYKK